MKDGNHIKNVPHLAPLLQENHGSKDGRRLVPRWISDDSEVTFNSCKIITNCYPKDFCGVNFWLIHGPREQANGEAISVYRFIDAGLRFLSIVCPGRACISVSAACRAI